jgi:glycine/D-amino acid oxidase-like deaminating enzyme
VGLSPYEAPGVFSLLAATELTDGVWYPAGGFGKVRAQGCGWASWLAQGWRKDDVYCVERCRAVCAFWGCTSSYGTGSLYQPCTAAAAWLEKVHARVLQPGLVCLAAACCLLPAACEQPCHLQHPTAFAAHMQVRDALLGVAAAAGVQVRTNTRVASIDTCGGRVSGVTLTSGEQLQADVVVSNADVPSTYALMAGSPGSSSGAGSAGSTDSSSASYSRQQHERLAQLDYSAGVIAFNWCCSQRFPRLLHHNVFLSGEYQRSWQRATLPATLCRCAHRA